MYGADMGSLSVQVRAGTGTWTEVWTRTGQQHAGHTDAWSTAQVPFAGTVLQVRFVGVTGSLYTGDAAVADVTLLEVLPRPTISGTAYTLVPAVDGVQACADDPHTLAHIPPLIEGGWLVQLPHSSTNMIVVTPGASTAGDYTARVYVAMDATQMDGLSVHWPFCMSPCPSVSSSVGGWSVARDGPAKRVADTRLYLPGRLLTFPGPCGQGPACSVRVTALYGCMYVSL